jgi:type II secretory pathway component PulK
VKRAPEFYDHPRNRGSVLILVLVVCLALVSITLTFGHSMMMAYRGADNDVAGKQAEQAIEGAARYAQAVLARDESRGRMPDVAEYESEAVPVGESHFWFIGRPAVSGGSVTETRAVSEPAFGLVDEASKLNLNIATREMLEALPAMTPELAAAIIDWRDADEDVSPDGAEAGTYLMKQPPYGCKNAPFESIEELALLQGADPAALFGEDRNLNGTLDPNEDDAAATLPEDDSDGTLDFGILEYVTVFSREPNTRADGTSRVDVSRATVSRAAFLREQFGDARALQIQARLGTTTLRSVLEFHVRGGLTPAEFEKVSGEITTSTQAFLTGRVNVNTASETVLACIPGIGPEHASQLVAAREAQGTPPATLAWVAETLPASDAYRAGPYLTSESWQSARTLRPSDATAADTAARAWCSTAALAHRGSFTGETWLLSAGRSGRRRGNRQPETRHDEFSPVGTQITPAPAERSERDESPQTDSRTGGPRGHAAGGTDGRRTGPAR